jgi:hypothetical protein
VLVGAPGVLAGDLRDGFLSAEHLHDLLREHLPDRRFNKTRCRRPLPSRSYFRPDPPVPIRVTGSLFWDVDHEDPPYVGPNDFKPKTAWEIHPISDIEFLEE